MVITSTISLQTRGDAATHDITAAVARSVTESGLSAGTVTIFCPGSASGLTTIEFEAGAVAGLQQVCDETLPHGRDHQPNGRWGGGNGHTVCRSWHREAANR